MDGGDPGSPVPDVRAALERLIQADESRLGEVYRGLQRGLPADAIAAELGVRTSNFVWNYKVVAEALLDGKIPASPHIAKQAAGRSRAVRAAARVPDDIREYLVALEARLDRHATNARPTRAPRERTIPSDVSPNGGVTTRRSSSLVAALRGHLERIDSSLAVDVLEYRGLLAVRDVEGAFERLLNGGAACAAFRELASAGRLDLTLEQLAVELGDHVSASVRETARARLAYFGERRETR